MDGIGLDGWLLSKVVGSLRARSVLINMHTLPHTPLFVIVASAWVRGNRGCVFFWVLFFPSPRQPRVLDTYHLMPYTNAGFNNIYKNGIWNWTLLPKSTVVKMRQPFAHFLLLLLFLSCLCLGSTKKRTHKKTHVAKHNNKRWKIKTVDGREKRKGDDYQEVDVNGKRLSHKNTRRSLQKLVSLGYKKKQTKWPIELWTLKQEMETDDDHANMRERFSSV